VGKGKKKLKEAKKTGLNRSVVTILSLNLRFGLAEDGPNNWVNRKESLAKLLGEYSFDFAGFQEANDFQIDFLSSVLEYYSYIGRRSPAPVRWQSNVIFYNAQWQCVHQDHFFLSPTPDIPSRFRDSKWPRQCTLGMFERGKDRIICINTHFDFDPLVQANSARIILNRIASLPPEVPVVLFGDFNTVPESPCHQVLTGKDPNRPSGGRIFQDAFCSPHPATFHGFTGKTDGNHIDCMLYNGALIPSACRVLQREFGGRYPSDHYPLYAMFDIL
jgi:endonuclease/exonuclease/phosphatase family metal-dependent hydrolase